MAETCQLRASVLFICVLFLLTFCDADDDTETRKCNDVIVETLHRNPKSYIFSTMHKGQDDFLGICIKGHSEVALNQIWSSVKVTLKFKLDGTQLYQAKSCPALYEARNPSFARRMLSWVADLDVLTSDELNMSPFGTSCFGIQLLDGRKSTKYDVNIELKVIHWQYVIVFILGLVLFWEADRLSRSVTFFYGSGIVLGVVVSLLLAVFILHRLVPSKGGAYMLLAGGWSMSLFVLQWTWNNLVDLVLDRNPFVIGYFLLAGLISFGLCYYHGPVRNQRGIDLIQWTIQCIALYLTYKGIQPESLALAVVITVAVTYVVRNASLLQKVVAILPSNWVSYRLRYFFFPPDLTLLTEDEFDAQGVEETRRALQELREYCTSPECDAWKIMSRIREPKRFASFVTEGLHITDDEYEAFEENPFTLDISEIDEVSDSEHD